LDVFASFLQALPEYHQEGLHLDLTAEDLAEPARFLSWAKDLHRAGINGEAAFERDRVPHRVLWWVHEDQYMGRVRINLALNDSLCDFGGHIGYDIRPSERGKGHATALLAEALRLANQMGIDPALLTCAPSNAASRKVIERNGGKLRDASPSGRLRFWCLTRLVGRIGARPEDDCLWFLGRINLLIRSYRHAAVDVRKIHGGLHASARRRWLYVVEVAVLVLYSFR
jgi:predicted acetyltransferase